jgi:LAS superfamily LD-carboxypeptidase LdcB
LVEKKKMAVNQQRDLKLVKKQGLVKLVVIIICSGYQVLEMISALTFIQPKNRKIYK